MNQSCITKAILAFFILFTSTAIAEQKIIPLTDWSEIKPDSIAIMTLQEIIEDGWSNNLSDIVNRYPGGISHQEDKNERIAASYNLSVWLTDLDFESNLVIFKPLSLNQHLADKSLVVKSLNISVKDDDELKKLLGKIKQILKVNFRKGGPSLRSSEQVGYFIPNHESCGDISVDWNSNKISNNIMLSVVVQCHN